MSKVELDSRYAECCQETKNWTIEYGEVVCYKCGRVLPEEVVAIAVLA
ncbi:MAG: hypothetical protein QXI43_04810 [Candidatus Nitrosocaldus sp.]